MTVDIRAITTCNLGRVISGSVNDSYIQEAGVITTSGSCVIDGMISPRMGAAVVFQYSKAGVARSIPRRLRVISSFANPYEQTTTVELGCLFTYLSDLSEPFDWRALDDPENRDSLTEQDVFIPPPISARTIAQICLEELGLSFDPIPLQSKFTIPEFEFGSPYVQILSDLLASESYCAYLDMNERVRFFELEGGGSYSGPRLSGARDLVSLAPIGSGPSPAETVIVSYSSTQLTAPDATEAELSEWGWDFEYTISTPVPVFLSVTIPGRPRRIEFRTFDFYAVTAKDNSATPVSQETTPLFELPEDETILLQWGYSPETITRTKYDDWGRIVKRIKITRRIFAEVNSEYLSQMVEAAGTPAQQEGASPTLTRSQSDSNVLPGGAADATGYYSNQLGSAGASAQIIAYNDFLAGQAAAFREFTAASRRYAKATAAIARARSIGAAMDVQYDFEKFFYEKEASLDTPKTEGYDTVSYSERYVYQSRAAAQGAMSLVYFDELGRPTVDVSPQPISRKLLDTAYPKYSLKDKPKKKKKLKKAGLRTKAQRTAFLATDDEDWLTWDEFIKQEQIAQYSGTMVTERVINSYDTQARNLVIDALVASTEEAREKPNARRRIEVSAVAKSRTETWRLSGLTERGQQALSSMNQSTDWYANTYRVGALSTLRAMVLVPDGIEVTLRSGRESVAQVRPTPEESSISNLLKDGTLYRMRQSTSAVLSLGLVDDERRIEFSLPYAPDDTLYKSGGQWLVQPGNPEAVARKYGIVQNRLLLGNRFGATIQCDPGRLPDRPFNPFFLDVNGIRVVYRTNGTSWAISSDGVLAGTDAMYWGAVGRIE